MCKPKETKGPLYSRCRRRILVGSTWVSWFDGTSTDDIRQHVQQRLGVADGSVFFVDKLSGEDVVLSSAIPDGTELVAEVAHGKQAAPAAEPLTSAVKPLPASKAKSGAQAAESQGHQLQPFAFAVSFAVLAFAVSCILPAAVGATHTSLAGSGLLGVASDAVALCERWQKPLLDALHNACAWSLTYLFVRRWGNPETRPNLHKYKADACYGMLAVTASGLLKEATKPYILQLLS